MSQIVIDCSVCMAWAYDDEASDLAYETLARLKLESAIVPQIWPLEVANSLLSGLRRNRISEVGIERFVDTLEGLPFELDEETSIHALHSTRLFGQRFGLSAYDAAYLELANRRRLELVTIDGRLKRAARELGLDGTP